MCRPHDLQSKRPSKRRTTTVSLKPARKTRSKRRKPKYLSLNLKLSSPQKNQQSSKKKTKMATKKQQQFNLFPLRPVNMMDNNRDMQEENNVNVVANFLFDAATDSTTTLNGLLSTTTTTITTTSDESPLSPPSLTYAYGGQDHNNEEGDSNDGLVRTAMRCKERDASEERWVSYSEVVEKNMKEEEVNSSIDDDDDHHGGDDDDDDVAAGAWCVKQVQGKKRRLALKLDYQEILNAWSDKGPLYVHGESPQTVPDLQDDNAAMDAWGGVGSLWRVPEMISDAGDVKANEEVEDKEGWRRERREASVLRYKEKRQNRLFSKRIRYEVRKLNAEKRPRMKGRFVKRSSEV